MILYLKKSRFLRPCLYENFPELYLGLEVAEETELDALQFHREYVAKNIPVIIRGGCASWPAVKKWTSQYFRYLV